MEDGNLHWKDLELIRNPQGSKEALFTALTLVPAGLMILTCQRILHLHSSAAQRPQAE